MKRIDILYLTTQQFPPDPVRGYDHSRQQPNAYGLSQTLGKMKALFEEPPYSITSLRFQVIMGRPPNNEEREALRGTHAEIQNPNPPNFQIKLLDQLSNPQLTFDQVNYIFAQLTTRGLRQANSDNPDYRSVLIGIREILKLANLTIDAKHIKELIKIVQDNTGIPLGEVPNGKGHYQFTLRRYLPDLLDFFKTSSTVNRWRISG